MANAYLRRITKKNGDEYVKRRDLIKKLEDARFLFKDHGGNYDTYKRGNDTEQVPRHTEINEITEKRILKKMGIEIDSQAFGHNLLTSRHRLL